MTQAVAQTGHITPADEKTLREQVVELIRNKGYKYRETPFLLSAGEWSHDYVDCKLAVERGDHLRLVAEAVLQAARDLGAEFDAVGGLTMGADSTAHAIALIAGKRWFSVRKEPKEHGKQKMIEGAALAPGTPVLLVDDVATTGGSIMKAVRALEEVGAQIVLAIPLVDRGEVTAGLLEERKIPYHPLMTYRDLDIPPVGRGPTPPPQF
jgi:orotate phosphoribosyltransferase